MSKNGKIGLRWYEDFTNENNHNKESKEIEEFFSKMLSEKLSEIFDKISKNPNRELLAIKGKDKFY